MLNKLKSLLLFILIFTITILSYNSQRVYALDGRTYVTIAEATAITAETAVATGASVAIAPVVVTTLVVGAALYGGYKLLDRYGSTIVDKISSTISSWDKTTTNDYLYEYSKDGQSYVGLTENGLNWSKQHVTSLVQETTSIPTVGTTTNTTDYSKPYMVGKVYVVPYSVVPEVGHVYHVAKLKNVDWKYIDVAMVDSSFFSTTSYINPNTDIYIRLIQVRSDVAVAQYRSYDSSWVGIESVVTVPGKTIGFGYTAPKGVIDIAPSDIVSPVTPVPLEVGQSISLPVTGTKIEGMTSYDTSATPFSVTQETYSTQSVADTLPSEGASTEPNTDSNTAPNLDLNVPNKDIPKLDFSPLMVATQKFPFCIPWDLWSSYKVFEGNSTPFAYEFKEINLNGTITGGQSITVLPNFKIDFAEYPSLDVAVQIFKYLQLLLFIVMLILKTRSLIRG